MQNLLIGNNNKYYIDYNKSAYANVIKWIDDKHSITESKPFIEYIRCDIDGNEYAFLSLENNDFKEIDIINYEPVKFENENVYALCYVAWIKIDLKNHSEFTKALSFSSNKVEVILGFKNGDDILEDCYEPINDYPTELKEEIGSEWIESK